jgi:hypothetical protein
MSLNGLFKVNVNMTNVKDNTNLSTATDSLAVAAQKVITTGKIYHDRITLSASEVEILDLGNGSLYNVYGESISLTGVTGLYVRADSTNSNTITVSGGTNSFLATQPAIGAGHSLLYGTNISLSGNTKLYLKNDSALSAQIVDIIVTGNE